ncbi:MAG: protein-glutamate O-methyltransferase CheR [Catalinimonas sp.]
MVKTVAPLDVDITDLRRLTAFVMNRYGVDFTNYATSSLRRRILRILELERLPSVDALLHKLESPDYLHHFVSEVTVNVTEMFRDPSFWRVLRDKVIPTIMLNHDKISVWHAGCSSGEEVFSMAVMLREMGLLDRAKIVATDLDRSILQRARQGRYTAKNMDLNEKNYIRFQGASALKDYYTVRDGFAHFDPTLVQNVSFREQDLVRGAAFSKFDLVLCRNVMIYFNQSLQNRVLTLLHESLFKYGYLAIGSKESLIWCEISSKFLVADNEEKVYKKVKE